MSHALCSWRRLNGVCSFWCLGVRQSVVLSRHFSPCTTYSAYVRCNRDTLHSCTHVLLPHKIRPRGAGIPVKSDIVPPPPFTSTRTHHWNITLVAQICTVLREHPFDLMARARQRAQCYKIMPIISFVQSRVKSSECRHVGSPLNRDVSVI